MGAHSLEGDRTLWQAVRSSLSKKGAEEAEGAEVKKPSPAWNAPYDGPVRYYRVPLIQTPEDRIRAAVVELFGSPPPSSEPGRHRPADTSVVRNFLRRIVR